MQPASKSQAGFTLIELLVVVAIIGILASIALTQYAVYKQQAVDGLMESTVQAGRHAMESYFVENNTYGGATETTLHDQYGFRKAATTTFSIELQNNLKFVIQVCAPGGTSAGMQFDSNVGHTAMVVACP